MEGGGVGLQSSEEIDSVVLFQGQGSSPEVDIDHGQQVLWSGKEGTYVHELEVSFYTL